MRGMGFAHQSAKGFLGRLGVGFAWSRHRRLRHGWSAVAGLLAVLRGTPVVLMVPGQNGSQRLPTKAYLPIRAARGPVRPLMAEVASAALSVPPANVLISMFAAVSMAGHLSPARG
jgi:hypothetical protein